MTWLHMVVQVQVFCYCTALRSQVALRELWGGTLTVLSELRTGIWNREEGLA